MPDMTKRKKKPTAKWSPYGRRVGRRDSKMTGDRRKLPAWYRNMLQAEGIGLRPKRVQSSGRRGSRMTGGGR